MRLVFKLGFLTILAVGLVLIVGCDKESDTTGSDLLVGDTTDFAFQEIEGLFSANDVHESFTVSADIAFDLLDLQFPDWDATSRGGSQHQAASLGDSSIIEITNYTYTNGWHVFSFGATVFESNMDVVTEFATLVGTDSVQVLAGGQPMAQPDSTANAFDVRAHFEWDLSDETASFAAHHSISMVADWEKDVPDITVNGALNQSHLGNWSIFPETDSAVTCTIDFSYNQTITDMVYLLDVQGDFADCPASGSLAVTAAVDLTCIGTGSGHELSVDGNWNVNATVRDNNQIRVTYSDGTTSWTHTETCGTGIALGLPNFPRP